MGYGGFADLILERPVAIGALPQPPKTDSSIPP